MPNFKKSDGFQMPGMAWKQGQSPFKSAAVAPPVVPITITPTPITPIPNPATVSAPTIANVPKSITVTPPSPPTGNISVNALSSEGIDAGQHKMITKGKSTTSVDIDTEISASGETPGVKTGSGQESKSYWERNKEKIKENLMSSTAQTVGQSAGTLLAHVLTEEDEYVEVDDTAASFANLQLGTIANI
jgi:hypothetical protein